MLADAVAAGTLPADLARQLRYWQRASVHEVTDYVRTVLPTVLPGALAAVATADEDAATAASSAHDVWSGCTWRQLRRLAEPAQEEQPDVQPVADVPATTQAVLSGPDMIVLPAATDELADPADSPDDPDEADEDRSRHHARRRLFVAGLTSTA